MKAGKRIALGCLLIVLLLVVGLLSTAGVMATLDPPESKRELLAQVQELETPRWNASDDGDEGLAPQEVEVFLDLHEGEFEILPGNPGEGIRIEADFDSGIYTLKQIHSFAQNADEESTERVKIQFHSKYSMLRRLMSDGKIQPKNDVKIYLPPDMPIHLRGDISIGECDMNLTGIPLTGIDLKLTLGDHHLRIDEPNPLQMDKATIYASKGEFDLDGMGNAHFETLDLKGSMGELSVDMTGDYEKDGSLKTRFRMGEVRVLLPETVKLDVKPARASMGEARTTVRENPDLPEDAPTLRVDTAITMGELRVYTPKKEKKEPTSATETEVTVGNEGTTGDEPAASDDLPADQTKMDATETDQETAPEADIENAEAAQQANSESGGENAEATLPKTADDGTDGV